MGKPEPWPIAPAALERGLRLGVIEGAFAYATFTLTSGAILAAFVYSSGMGAFQYGLFTAMPFLAQLLQFPNVALLRRWPDRRAMTVLYASIGRLSLLGVTASLLLLPPAARGAGILASFTSWSVFSALAGGSWLWWMRDLVPRERLGRYFGNRGSALVAASAPVLLGAGFFLDWVRGGGEEGVRYAFAALFATAAAFGMVSSAILAKMPHPPPADDPKSVPIRESLTVPFRDRNYRSLLAWLGIWWFATTLTVPFLVVFLIADIGLTVSFVTLLLLVGIASTVVFLHLWGRLSDRFGNKPVLRVSVPVLAAALVLCSLVPTSPAPLNYVLIIVIQVLLSLSAAGADLTAWNLAFKLSKGPHAPAFLASTSLVRALATGLGPLVGGTLALVLRGTSILVVAPIGGGGGTVLLQITRFPLIFLTGAALVLCTGWVLMRVKEEGEAPRSELLDALRLEADDALVPGVRHFAAATTVLVQYIVHVEERTSARLDSGMETLRGALDAARGEDDAQEPGPPGPRGT
jgi:hypothetical protein